MLLLASVVALLGTALRPKIACNKRELAQKTAIVAAIGHPFCVRTER